MKRKIESDRIYCLDALEGLSSLEDNSIGLILTSPPFKDKDIEEDYYIWLDKIISECKRVSPFTMMFNSSTRLIDICKRYNPARVLIWYKTKIRLAYRYEPIFIFSNGINMNSVMATENYNIWSDCLSIPPVVDQFTPYQNPIKLYENLLKYFPKAKLICDPFMGSGTTALAAKEQDRDFIGFEKEPDRVAMAEKRLSEMSTTKLESFA